MKGPLFKWFLIWSAAMAVGVMLFWAFGPTAKKINLQEVNFSTTESSALYFRNMRSFFYDWEEEEQSGYNLYRIDSREANSLLHFLIVQNWRMSEAYIMTESDRFDIKSSTLKLIAITEETDTISINGADAEANYIFAAQLFAALERDAEITILLDNKEFPLLEKQSKSIKASLKDYFKLVGKLR